MKKIPLSIVVALVLAIALPLCAQTGCTDSPEDPTILLALLAGAGVYAVNIWRAHRR